MCWYFIDVDLSSLDVRCEGLGRDIGGLKRVVQLKIGCKRYAADKISVLTGVLNSCALCLTILVGYLPYAIAFACAERKLNCKPHSYRALFGQ